MESRRQLDFFKDIEFSKIIDKQHIFGINTKKVVAYFEKKYIFQTINMWCYGKTKMRNKTKGVS